MRVLVEEKKLVTSDGMLVHFNSLLTLKLACDASSHGISAAILYIKSYGTEQSMVFVFHSLTAAEWNYIQVHK